MYITHVRTGGGKARRSILDQVPAELVNAARHWIAGAIGSGPIAPAPLPEGCLGSARLEHGGLVVEITAVEGRPVLEIRVAKRSRHSAVWRSASIDQPDQHKPKEPWCATHLAEGTLPFSVEQLTALEDGIAWAWITFGPASPAV